MARSTLTSRRFSTLVTAMAITAFVTLGVAGCAPEPSAGGGSGGSSTATPPPIPTGVEGAAFFDEGYLKVGTGATVVDLYFDPMCPICGVFDKTNGAFLTDQVDTGAITLRLHPMNFLNRFSQGTDYSSRAGSALTCVAAQDESKTLAYFTALFAEQPKENSEGLTNEQLGEIAVSVGAMSVADCVANGTYTSWIQSVNDAALAGPIPGSDVKAIEGTPTTLVNGKPFTGSLTDAAAFEKFVADNS
ncbi:DsbA family protein [Leifsonia sp. YAF41]|uniref:DsbA family protein n=1 Tax=Leifsonia sp. YAF41 TaxID=3233086 RepID=UPI003F9B8E1E